ncbi:hypothetical protein [Planctomycetes bacterium K23_9]|uniref:Tetratricopeptide repeat protein n=1 Tax=Stieleria marina TaxID=1930275 RepID=A0A517P189_9BACT|nr:hypothetical protein K239x_51560 [Planctomycetes bacterium K23_9]
MASDSGSVHDESSAKDWDEEVVHWRGVCDDSPENVAAFLRLAEALRWIGQFDEAADVLAQFLPLVCEPLERAERKFEAIEFRRRFAEIASVNENNLFQLSVLLGGVEENDESLAYYRRQL